MLQKRPIHLLKNGGCKNKEFLLEVEKCCDNCQFCIRYGHTKPKPIVAPTNVERFNKVVYMDLKQVTKVKLWILHFVDSATRYTAAALIQLKMKHFVVENFQDCWHTLRYQ